MTEDKTLTEILYEKGILGYWPGNPDNYFCLSLQDHPNPEISSFTVEKAKIEELVSGTSNEVHQDIHQELDRKSLYDDGIIDVKFFDGEARITLDREKQLLNVLVSGGSYWDTR